MSRAPALVDKEIGSAVRALSVCRAFNREIYFKLGEELRFHATEAAFNVLSRFSFVWREEQRGEGWYRIHHLLRRIVRKHDEGYAGHADEVLEKYYRQQSRMGEPKAAAEAIYHANQQDWEQGSTNG